MSFRTLVIRIPRPRWARDLGRSLALACVASLCGCALLSPPPALTTLRLSEPPPALRWPTAMRPGRVTAAVALRSDRVVVADGALLMQHAGLRWVDAPAPILSEYVRRVHAIRSQSASASDPSLDLWLTEFHLSVDAAGITGALVGLSGELRCPSGATRPVAPARSFTAVGRDDARAIAAGFSAATAEAVARVLNAASEQRPGCARALPAGQP
jgi:ABC-type uncharacterized transport system auxiliary subunit